MSRLLCALVALLALASLGAMPAAHADEYANMTTIPLGYSTYMLRDPVEVHLEYIEISDFRRASTQTTTPLERVKWFRLFYQYENHGDSPADGDLKVRFYDEKNNEYKLDDNVFTGERMISPHSIGSVRFIELPISKDSNIVKISIIKGFDAENFTVPLPSSWTPTPVVTANPPSTSTPTAIPTAMPTSAGTGGCLPFLPFAILGTVGLAGVIAGNVVKRQ